LLGDFYSKLAVILEIDAQEVTANVLREALKKCGFSTTGNKGDLAARLLTYHENIEMNSKKDTGIDESVGIERNSASSNDPSSVEDHLAVLGNAQEDISMGSSEVVVETTPNE